MKLKIIFRMTLGFVFLGMGAVGIALPLLPTTPFVLLAAVCFSPCNQRLEAWLLRNRFFGPYIENYRTKQGIKRNLKIKSIVLVWIGLITSMITIGKPWVYAMLMVVGAGVTIHLLCINSKEEKPKSDMTNAAMIHNEHE